MVDGSGHMQPKLQGQIMSKQAPIHATWAICAPPAGVRASEAGLNFLGLRYGGGKPEQIEPSWPAGCLSESFDLK